MFKLGLSLAALAICNAVLLVLMPWYVITRLGVGIQTDAFFASAALPQLVFSVATFSLTQVLVPLLATESEHNFRRDAWSLFLGVSGIMGILAVVLFLAAEAWVSLIVPGFSQEARQLTITLTRIQLLAMIGNATIVVLWSTYYARQKFLWTELSSLIANTIGLIFLIQTLPRFGVIYAAWATVLTLALKILMLIPGLGRWERPQWDSYFLKEAWRRVKPFLLGQTYAKSDPVIDRFLTSLTIAGNLSLLYIGQQVYSAVNLIMTKAISAPSVPRLAIAAKAADWTSFRHLYRSRVLWTLVTTAAATGALVAVGEPVLRQMIGHGGITIRNVHQLWWILIALSGVLIGGTSGQVISSAFYALGDTRTPTMLFMITYTIYIPIKIVVFLKYGVLGLAAVTSVHLAINFLLQLVILERRVGAPVTTVEAR